MARKLIAVAALVALVSLAAAGAAVAATYYLTGESGNIIYEEIYGQVEFTPTPGSANGEFVAGYPYMESTTQIQWGIARLKNTVAAVDTNTDQDYMTYTVTYDTLRNDGEGIWKPPSYTRFYYAPIGLESFDLEITTTATYLAENEPDGTWVLLPGETLIGTGHDPLGTEFRLTGVLGTGQYNSYGHNGSKIWDLTLEYPYVPSAVPLPAGIWLLGTGLLGLACLGWRRRR